MHPLGPCNKAAPMRPCPRSPCACPCRVAMHPVEAHACGHLQLQSMGMTAQRSQCDAAAEHPEARQAAIATGNLTRGATHSWGLQANLVAVVADAGQVHNMRLRAPALGVPYRLRQALHQLAWSPLRSALWRVPSGVGGKLRQRAACTRGNRAVLGIGSWRRLRTQAASHAISVPCTPLR